MLGTDIEYPLWCNALSAKSVLGGRVALTKFLYLLLQMGMILGLTVDTSMDCLVVFSELAIVSKDCLFNMIGHHHGLHMITLVLSIDPDNLQMKSPPLPFSVIHL